jgi:hypothetical protein
MALISSLITVRHLTTLTSVLFLLLLDARLANSCWCFSEPLCNDLPRRTGTEVIFVGRVTDLYPASIEVYGPLLSQPQRSAKAKSAANQRLSRGKAIISSIWNGELTGAEELAIKSADSEDGIRRASELAAYARRVRFHVQEWLVGPQTAQLDIFTDFTSCGYRFKLGETYLVVAKRTATVRWWTGACSGTEPIASAGEDLKALRAWRDGHPLQPRVYGVVRDGRLKQPGQWIDPPLPSVPMLMICGDSRLEAKSDQEGRFSFDDLGTRKYRLEVGLPSWQGSSMEVDLSHDRCCEVYVHIEQQLDGIGYTIHRVGAPRAPAAVIPELPQPPVINPADLAIPNLPQALLPE